MGAKDPRVDDYIARSAAFARPILVHLRKVVHAGCPGVVETMRWNAPHFDYEGPLAGMQAFKEHCAFGFWKWKLLDVPDRPAGRGMGQFGCIRSVKDLPAAATLRGLVKQAARLNEEGVKVPKARRAPRPEIAVPGDLVRALSKNKAARQTFEHFSPSHRRGYLEWITEAKTDETRSRRIAQAVEWMAEGRSRNWKYEPKGKQ